jgi:hypothetical protein
MEDTQSATDAPFPLHKLILGLILVGVGVLAFVDAIDLYNPWQIWKLWPLGLIILGLSSETESLMARRSGGGAFLIGVGVWMLAGTHHIFGLSYRTGFPLGIAIVGLFMVLHAIVDKPQVKKESNDDSR